MSNLKTRSEHTEIRALESLHRACPEDLKGRLGLEWLEIGSVCASVCREDPSILLNRAVGLGLAGTVEERDVEAVLDAYASRGIGDWFFHVYEENLYGATEKLLKPPGMHRRRGWMKFVSTRPAGRPVRSPLTVERVDRDSAIDFATIVCGAFGLRTVSIPLIAALASDDRWQLFLSRDGDTPAGAGGLFIDGNFGWLDWAATEPAFRRRGSQSAIMARRLELAARLGCEAVFTETGEAVDGDPQHSYGNILKAGFEKLGPRLNYSPRPAPV
jgi:GNAT superfamily N-acetyltransferase